MAGKKVANKKASPAEKKAEEQPEASAPKSKSAVSAVSTEDVRKEPYRIDKGEALPPFVNPNLNPDRAK